MREQALSLRSLRRELALCKDNVVADGECARLQSFGGARCLVASVDANITEVLAEPGLHTRSCGPVETAATVKMNAYLRRRDSMPRLLIGHALDAGSSRVRVSWGGW
jgi:hypothetical protein